MSETNSEQTARRPWHERYPAGMKREAPQLPFANLGEMVREMAARYREKTAHTVVLPNGMEASLDFGEVDELSDAFAAWLRNRAKISPGDRVAVLLPNLLAYPVCAFGVLKAGGVVVNTNPLYTERELALQLKDSGAKVLVILDKFADKLAAVLPQTQVEHVVVSRIADFFALPQWLLISAKLRLSGQVPAIGVPFQPLSKVLRLGRFELAREKLAGQKIPAPTRADVALLQYTGGTTGTSKGAMLTHGCVLANVGQIDAITEGYLTAGRETILTVLPLYHIFAFTINLLFGFYTGAHNVLVPNPRPLRNLKPAFKKYPISWTTVVNTLLKGLVGEGWFEANPPKHLRSVYAGGSATQPEVLRKFEQLTGALVIEGYGMSEASPLITFNPAVKQGQEVRRYLPQVGGVGLPLPGTDLTVVADDGTPVAVGEPGEILVRGPQVMKGYWNQPEETQRTMRDGWLHTGDIGRFDADGYLEITDRKKDMIIVSGFKVYPNEVEACIAQHPDVADVAVVGVPDDMTGEAVRAFVVPKSGDLTAEALREHCKQLLINYKIPRNISFLGEMPKNAIGKVLRRELRAKLRPQT